MTRAVAVKVLVLLAATSAEAATLEIHWTDTSDNETNFHIERKEIPTPPGPIQSITEAECSATGAYMQLIVLPRNTTSHKDPTVVEGLTYCYRLYASNQAGRSNYSNQAGKTVPFFSVPNAPSNLEIPQVTP